MNVNGANRDNNGNAVRIYHPFGPLYNENSHVLILGSFPSVKSREQEFFYGHPQNRFWKVIAALFSTGVSDVIEKGPASTFLTDRLHKSSPLTGADAGLSEDHEGVRNICKSSSELLRLKDGRLIHIPQTIDEKKTLILSNGLALWDSIGSCEITGSSDASIRNAEPNDLRVITDNCDIRAIYCNGKKSLEVYNRYIEPLLGRRAAALPSTSPANAAWSLDRLIEAWSVITDCLKS